MIVVSTSVPGAGGTTVVRQAMDEVGGWKHRNYGDVMVEIAEDRGLVDDRDEMRKLDPSQQKELQKGAAKKLAEEGEESDVVVDTHCTVNTPKGYLPGLPQWVLKELGPDAVLVVEAGADEVSARREKDAEERERDVQSLEEIDEHQMVNRMAAMSYATLTGATVKIVQNPDGGLDEAAGKVVEVLR